MRSPSVYISKDIDAKKQRASINLFTKALQPNMGDLNEKRVSFDMPNNGDSSSTSSKGEENLSIT